MRNEGPGDHQNRLRRNCIPLSRICLAIFASFLRLYLQTVSNLFHCISYLEPTLSCHALIRPWREAKGKTVMVETFNEGDSRRAKGFWHFGPCAPGGWRLLGRLARRTAGQSTGQTAGQAASQPSGGETPLLLALERVPDRSGWRVRRILLSWVEKRAFLLWSESRCHTSGFSRWSESQRGGQSSIYPEEMTGAETIGE